MKRLLTLAAVTLSFGSIAHAEFLFDNFTTARGLSTAASLGGPGILGPTAMDAVAGGTRTATITGAATDWREGNYDNTAAPPVGTSGPGFLSLTPNQHSLRNNTGGGSLVLDYDLASDFDFTDDGQYVLLLDLFSDVTPLGVWSYTVTLADGATTASVSGTATQGVLALEDADFGAPLTFATTIDRISVSVSTSAGGSGLARTSTGTGARIVAVPEPSAIALLGFTGIGGVLFARRRRKAEKAEKSV